MGIAAVVDSRVFFGCVQLRRHKKRLTNSKTINNSQILCGVESQTLKSQPYRPQLTAADTNGPKYE